jgi:hypothetical protein
MENLTMAPIFKVEVLIDKVAGNLSIQATDDTDGTSVETTLSSEEAWVLVIALNSAIHQLAGKKKQTKPKLVHETPVVISEPKEEQVQAAVKEAIGADQLRPRHLPPGPVRNIKIAGLRDRVQFPSMKIKHEPSS